MFNCIWIDKKINSLEISEPESREREIREAVSHKELRCIDPDCKTPIGFRHGPSDRRPHFYHLPDYDSSKCKYSYFEKNDKETIKEVRYTLFQHFKSNGYNVENEYRLPVGGKFCHLMFDTSNKKIILQISDKSTREVERKALQAACDENKYALKWIVVDDPNRYQDRYHNHLMNRYLFDNSANRDLVIIDKKGETVSQTKYNDDQRLHGIQCYYHEIKPLEQLVLENGEITIKDFYQRAEQWFLNKLEEVKREQEREEEERRRWEEERKRKREEAQKMRREAERKRKENIERSRASAEAIRSKQPANREPYLKMTEPSAREKNPLSSEDQCKIGTKIYHSVYEVGTITERIADSKKVRIKFENGKEDIFSVEALIKSGRNFVIES